MNQPRTVEIETTLADVVDALEECEREAGVRARVYPQWIRQGRIKEATACERQRRLHLAVDILNQVWKALRGPRQQRLEFF
ncbi:MAG: hypothetical protein ACOX9C_06515 [Kiritimatiellia bacterium]|jgi:hypothetical protein